MRVTSESPCPICRKPDWCGVSPDGQTVVCMRTVSDRPSRNGGYKHYIGNGKPECRRGQAVRMDLPVHPEDWGNLQSGYRDAVHSGELELLSSVLHLSAKSLQRLRIGWSGQHRAWSFPMRAADGTIVGFRLRTPKGKKLAVRGGKEGLFIPDPLDGSILLIAEGPTDTAALLDLGFDAIGRPSCRGAVKHIIRYVRRIRPSSVVVASDNDEPGIAGAEALVRKLCLYVRDLRLIQPPLGIKDIRQWKARGATQGEVAQVIANAEMVKARSVSASREEATNEAA